MSAVGAEGGEGAAGAAARGALDAAAARDWLRGFAAAVAERSQELTDLDRPVGDSDHGVNLLRGTTAVLAGLDEGAAAPGEVLGAAGRTLVSTVGGASGPLFGTALRRAGKALGEVPAADAAQVAAALRAALEGVVRLGEARVGDATMVDALDPAVAAFERAAAAGEPLARAARDAAAAAARGAASTVPLVARKGRASYLGPRSEGHLDPGARSVELLLTALADALGGPAGEGS
ncbi:dihydroxyacetone kinase subunit DhaL [Kineococcus sp. SYSU DK005]|uniref:dihydroxyacetone kinase subunit DhaL n=1 Tax=Kineococcus sp. SYSU DK005 TaxID=3383126 RepID=UPI003D7E11A2